MNSSQAIRAIVVGLPVRDGHVLVQDDVDKVKGQPFHRAIGGGIEFWETSEAALRREFMEELGVQLGDVHLLGVVENLFEYEGQPGHEVAFVYAVESDQIDDISLDTQLVVLDQPELPIRWVPLDDEWPLYPSGVEDLLGTDEHH